MQCLMCKVIKVIPEGRQVKFTCHPSHSYVSECREKEVHFLHEPPHDKTNKMTAPSDDSDQPGHPPSLIRVFAVHSMGC